MAIHRLITPILFVAAVMISSRASAAERLRVVTYNVWGVPVIAPARVDRIHDIARRLAELSPDVVVLQEVWVGEDAAVLATTLAEAGLIHQRDYGTEPLGSGMMLMSRYPIARDRFESFTAGKKVYVHWHLDWIPSKGVAVAVIEAPAGPVQVAATHLQSHYAFGDYDFVQLSQLMQIAGLTQDRSMPLIFAGDINAHANTLVADAMSAVLDVLPADPGFEKDVIMARGLAATSVDTLFVEPVELATGVTRTLSDHPCLVADFALQPCPACRAPAEQRAHVTSRIQQFTKDNTRDTEWFISVSRVLSVLLVPIVGAAAWQAWRRRRRGRLALFFRATLTLWLLVCASWLAYFGWSYGAHKLEALAELRASIDAAPATKP